MIEFTQKIPYNRVVSRTISILIWVIEIAPMIDAHNLHRNIQTNDVIMLNLRKLANIRGWHSKFKRCVETPLAIEVEAVVRNRGGDGHVKDNSDWWKVTEARIIKKTSGQLQRARYLS